MQSCRSDLDGFRWRKNNRPESGLFDDIHWMTICYRCFGTRAPKPTGRDDKDGTLWLGYLDVVYRVQNRRVTKLTTKDGVPSGTVRSLTSDGAGNIWLAKGDQIGYFTNGNFNPVATAEGVQCMAPAHTNAVWLVANAHLLSCNIEGNLQDFGSFLRRFRGKNKRRHCWKIMAASVWIGTDGNGLFHYDHASFERMNTSHSSILSLAEDNEDNIWAGTGGGD